MVPSVIKRIDSELDYTCNLMNNLQDILGSPWILPIVCICLDCEKSFCYVMTCNLSGQERKLGSYCPECVGLSSDSLSSYAIVGIFGIGVMFVFVFFVGIFGIGAIFIIIVNIIVDWGSDT